MTTPHTRDEDELLARARAGLSPSPGDATRVRASVAAALAATVAPGLDGTHAASAPGLASATRPGWSLRVLLTSVTAAAMGAGAVGYWMGHDAGVRAARSSIVPSAPIQRDDAPAPHEAPDVAATAAPEARDEAPAGREAVTRRPARLARGSRPPVMASTASLEQEVRALRAIERALRDDDPRLALALLQQLDRDVPQGKLVEERRATSAIARCSLGDVPFGVDLAEDFAGDHPHSVYLGRVEQSCRQRGRHQ